MSAPSELRSRLDAARARISPHVHRTPLLSSSQLDALTGHRVTLKAELFQKTGSYKPRGMLNHVLELDATRRAAGVVTFSAGNAAQGLAYAARVAGCPATVIMPQQASAIKSAAAEDYGARVLYGRDVSECIEICDRLVREDGLALVPPFDDRALMEGHASLGLEVLEDGPEPDAIFVAVGGGGMIGGVTHAIQATEAGTRIVPVEPVGAAGLARSQINGQAARLETTSTIADGLAAPDIGAHCFEVVQDRVSSTVVITDDQIRAAMLFLVTRCKLCVEPAGAASVAGLLYGDNGLAPGSRVCCILSGGNVDPARLGNLLQS